MKKILSYFLCVITFISLFTACTSKENSNESSVDISSQTIETSTSDNLSSTRNVNRSDSEFNIIEWENVKYNVNPVLNSAEDIDTVDINENNGMTRVVLRWNYFSTEAGDGYSDVLVMYYENSLSEIKVGNQSIIGSAYYEYNEEFTIKWSYYDGDNNLIYYTINNSVFDNAGNEIAYISQDGSCKDLNGNSFDITSLDPSLEIIESFNG